MCSVGGAARHLNGMGGTLGKLTVIHYSDEVFADRGEAGRLLGVELEARVGAGAVVLGIPRGGVVVAEALAEKIGGIVDVVLARKLRAPGNPELAMGAIGENGQTFIDDWMVWDTEANTEYIEQETKEQKAEIDRRRVAYRQVWDKVPLAGKEVIVTDDGVATGATMRAALLSVRQEGPEILIAAVPLGAGSSLSRLTPYADEVICLRQPEFFDAVGRFYGHFEQVAESELMRILKRQARAKVKR